MDEKHLVTYLNDHLAGSVAGIELAESCLERNAGTPLGDFLAHLLRDLKEDQEVVRGMLARYGAGESGAKKATAWLAEKASRLKMVGVAYSDLSRLQELEMLVVGIRGKLALWVALEEVGRADPRLHGIDFRTLQERAQRQMEEVERRRLAAARDAFSPDGDR
jgi:hypothetical protein